MLLLPRVLEDFILRDQAEDLLSAENAVAVEPARVPYGAWGRLPEELGLALAGKQARRLRRNLPGRPRAIAFFHPLQFPLALALASLSGDCELWYGRWDRYEHAYDAGPKLRSQLTDLHEAAAARADVTFVASSALGDIERSAGHEPVLVSLAADSFPAPDPSGAVVGVSLGHLGRRCDWALLRGVGERMPELTLLLIGTWHDDEVGSDADYRWCREHPGFVWLGRRSDEEAARLIGCADVGIVPFKVEPFNDAGLPYRILKHARLGRKTITPELSGVLTWERAVVRCATADEWVTALRGFAGARAAPDLELREWALAQTARAQNGPLWERMRGLGIA